MLTSTCTLYSINFLFKFFIDLSVCKRLICFYAYLDLEVDKSVYFFTIFGDVTQMAKTNFVINL